ncbi:MAG: PLP-dependent aminotransferase family protein [Verrucomicrobia bacterium]|nr:PLP-dependent aminotransferase family protein [Verrucomicrobiota bacterium]
MTSTCSGGLPLYRRLADEIAASIERGALRVGERVPSIREICAARGVSPTTALQAYSELESSGWIQARPRSGYYVRSRLEGGLQLPGGRPVRSKRARTLEQMDSFEALLEAQRHPDILPLGAATPGPELYPYERLNRIIAAQSRRAGKRLMGYESASGCIELRTEIARRCLAAGVQADPEEITVTIGCTEALQLCLRATTAPGDTVVVESPTYYGVLQIIQELGLRALEVPSSCTSGLDLEAFEEALNNHPVKAAFVQPNYQNPHGGQMSEEKKQRLARLASDYRVPVLEDDIFSDLTWRGAPRPTTAKGHDTDGWVLLCSSYSKAIAPGLRVGWTLPGRFAERVRKIKQASTGSNPGITELATRDFLRNGGYDRHLRSAGELFRAQVDRMREAVLASFPSDVCLSRPSGGYLLWVQVHHSVDALELAQAALHEKISIAPGPMFSASGGFKSYFRLNCGTAWSPAIERGIAVLGRMVRERMASISSRRGRRRH